MAPGTVFGIFEGKRLLGVVYMEFCISSTGQWAASFWANRQQNETPLVRYIKSHPSPASLVCETLLPKFWFTTETDAEHMRGSLERQHRPLFSTPSQTGDATYSESDSVSEDSGVGQEHSSFGTCTPSSVRGPENRSQILSFNGRR